MSIYIAHRRRKTSNALGVIITRPRVGAAVRRLVDGDRGPASTSKGCEISPQDIVARLPHVHHICPDSHSTTPIGCYLPLVEAYSCLDRSAEFSRRVVS